MAAKKKPELAWHWVGSALRDGRPIPADGEWLVHDGGIEPCVSGLHASPRIFDALGYAPGGTVCRVAVAGKIKRESDKLVASKRVILWRLETTEPVLRAFARKAALSVIHLWDAPDIVRRFLETGDEGLRDAAWAAAWAAAWDAAWAATGDAAWAATRAAAWAAARDAARDAAWAATGDAAWAAARDAAWAATTQKFNDELEAMIREAAGNPDDAALLQAVSPDTAA
jgi:hypothetical protein